MNLIKVLTYVLVFVLGAGCYYMFGDIVEFPGEKVLPVGGVIGGAQGVDPDVRVDVPAPPGRDFCLILPSASS